MVQLEQTVPERELVREQRAKSVVMKSGLRGGRWVLLLERGRRREATIARRESARRRRKKQWCKESRDV